MWTFDRFRSTFARPESWQRRLVRAAGILLVLVCWARPHRALAVGRRYEVREVQPNVYVWIPEDIIDIDGDPQYTRAGNAGFVVTNDGVVIVNATNSPFHAREMLYEIRQRTSEPVRYVIDTGGAGDEVLGNEVFADLQAPILSTPAIQAEIQGREQSLFQRANGNAQFQRRLRGIHITPPNQTFQGEKQLSLGGHVIRLISFDPSLQSLAVSLPSSKVAFLGDLFQNEFVPQLESRDIHKWIEALKDAETWDIDVYIPGHGDPGGKKDVEQFRQFLEWLTNEVQARMAEGKSLDQTKAELLPLTNYGGHARELAPEFVADLYRQLAGTAKISQTAKH
ncbi:MAG TPA: MBL fold metallo-hydrolase [Terriglobia bacterium]|nr:MBL fold metallo-hydrolase [Terriglobia bacterium]